MKLTRLYRYRRVARVLFALSRLRRRVIWLGTGCRPPSPWGRPTDFKGVPNRIRVDRIRQLLGLPSGLDEEFWRSMARRAGPFAVRAFERRLYELRYEALTRRNHG